MKMIENGGIRLHVREDGDPNGAPVVFSNSLGTDMRLWDLVLPLLPSGLRFIRYDKRGHGLSTCPDGAYSMGALVSDAEAVMEHFGVKDALFVGLSVGGLIAQGIAVKRPDMVRSMVLSNTGAKIGTTDIWADRIKAVHDGGIEKLADATMERWFSKAFQTTPELELWRNLLVRQPDAGYAGTGGAISGTDFYTPTASLRIPTLGIAGSEDAATPPDLVRETVDLIPGSQFHLIRNAGHLPCVEQPQEYADVLIKFMKDTGHI